MILRNFSFFSFLCFYCFKIFFFLLWCNIASLSFVGKEKPYEKTFLLADAEMSTHTHIGVRTENPYEMIERAWLLYTRYFNNKYRRQGRLGEKTPFVLELEGLHHILAAICYILRNPLHHGLSLTPFGYAHSSANTYFSKELGKFNHEELLTDNHLTLADTYDYVSPTVVLRD